MQTLSRQNLDQLNVAHVKGAPVLPVNILQIGDGNFLRAFADWMIDVANGAGVFNGEVVMAQPLSRGIAERLNEQDACSRCCCAACRTAPRSNRRAS